MSKRGLAKAQLEVGKATAYFIQLERAMQAVGEIMSDIDELGFSAKDLEQIAEESMQEVPQAVLEWIRG